MSRGPGLGAVSLIALIAVAVGCGQTTAPTDRDGGVSAAAAATAADAARGSVAVEAPIAPAAPSTTAAPASIVAPPTVGPTSVAPTSAAPASSSSLLVPVPPTLDQEVSVPDAVSINTARVVVNQSNVATSSDASSVVDSTAARLVARVGPDGLEIVSLDVHPGWTEVARSSSGQRLALRYVSGTDTVEITLTSNGTGVSSSVVASSDR